jgi:lysine decarboxylase
VVFILTGADGEEQINRLEGVLETLGLGYQPPYQPEKLTPPEIETVCSPRAAVFGACEQVLLSQAAGRIAAEQVAPYPPGVPVIAPGERIQKKHLEYLHEIGYNRLNDAVLVLQ